MSPQDDSLLLMIGTAVALLIPPVLSVLVDKRPERELKPVPSLEFGIFQPVFFQDAEYLRLLHLTSNEDASCAVDLVRECCRSVPSPYSDIQTLLTHPDWRPHLVAAVALIISGHDTKTIEAAWRRVDTGSWITPQLAAALYLVDPDFAAEAQSRLEFLCPLDPSEIEKLSSVDRHITMGPASARQRSAKTASALLRLLETKQPAAAHNLRANDDLQFLLKADMDASGEIAERWLSQIKTLTARDTEAHDASDT